ncbi:hypothetical protein EVAR_94785_1 [Eumeta japonica]|uniref:Uncharacterized protein n=1 Tax=Eumeta variegata TaxID=151549 RepID=A0A4C1UI46_EUMVA|nr:hypothetical protein EVAR_94785_1 [Eumeta japonica]
MWRSTTYVLNIKGSSEKNYATCYVVKYSTTITVRTTPRVVEISALLLFSAIFFEEDKEEKNVDEAQRYPCTTFGIRENRPTAPGGDAAVASALARTLTAASVGKDSLVKAQSKWVQLFWRYAGINNEAFDKTTFTQIVSST